MFSMVLIALGCILALLFGIVFVIPSAYVAFMSTRHSRAAAHLRRYRLHVLEKSLRA